MSNISAEAEALAGRLPAALPDWVSGATTELAENGSGFDPLSRCEEGRNANELPSTALRSSASTHSTIGAALFGPNIADWWVFSTEALLVQHRLFLQAFSFQIKAMVLFVE